MPRMKKTPQDRPSAWKLLLRRQRWLLRPLFWGGAGLFAILLATSLTRSLTAGASITTWRDWLGGAVGLPVREIRIEGRANTPEPLLRAALGIAKGDPILSFSVEGARQRIESLSSVAHVAVERRLPGTVYVRLVERRPFAIWQDQGHFVLIDRNGQVVDNEDVADFTELPLVVGAGAPAHAAALFDALAEVPEIRSRVAAAIRVAERRWNLQLRNGATVMLPQGEERPALHRLMQLQSSDLLLDRPLAVIDMRLPDRLVVRVAHPAAPLLPDAPKRAT